MLLVYAAENGVTVTVTDAMGIKGTVSNTSGFSEEINPINNALIKGDCFC